MAEGSTDKRSMPGQPGIAVDATGGQVIDPTKNVEDLVEAKSKSDEALRRENQRFFDAQLKAADNFHNFAREANEKFSNYARESETRFQRELTSAETRRIDQLAQTRQEFQNTIRDMLAESVRTTSTLVSTQLVQIQATFDTRVSKLEAQAFTAAGRSSVADPAMESAMSRMSSGIASVATQTSDSLTKMAAANAEGIAKLTVSMAAMQASAAAAAGEQTGSGEATSAQARAAAFEILKTQVGHSSTQITVSIAVGVVAAISLVLSIFIAIRTGTQSAYEQPRPAYREPAPNQSAPQQYRFRGTDYRVTPL
jgi:cobalamin biosynthesis Mg chelatase CobN